MAPYLVHKTIQSADAHAKVAGALGFSGDHGYIYIYVPLVILSREGKEQGLVVIVAVPS